MAQRGFILLCVFVCLWVIVRGNHECDRLCFGNVSPKKCYYHFTVGISQRKNVLEKSGSRKIFLAINGVSPGPSISVCQNDTVIVDVKNELPSGLETSMHWHGFSEGNSPFMDGVPMITQCPISPRTTFRYQLKAHKSGTFFYRAHSVAQQLDGIFGPIIVRDNGNNQNTLEKILIISAEMETLQVFENGYEQNLNVADLRINVYNVSFREDKQSENVAQRVRIINVAALDCPISLFTHIVPLKVIAVDGNPVKPIGLNEVIINPGERVDLLVKAEVMKVTHVIGHNLCKGHTKYGLDPTMSDKSDESVRERNLNFSEYVLKLESEKEENLPRGDLRMFLSYDASVYTEFKGVVDFRYKLGALTPYAPSILSKNGVSILQFHNKSFIYPPSPILSQSEILQSDLICQSDEISTRCRIYNNGFCECMQIIDLPFNYNLDVFLIDEGRNHNFSHTFHIHGHSFHVLSVKSFDRPISAAELWEKEVLGEIRRNLVNPVKKDTITVPNKGFVTLRIRPRNPGKWLLESTTSKAKSDQGLEVVLNVEDPTKEKIIPEGFPTCGNMKEPDLVFTDD